MPLRIGDPYASRPTRWLKGEIHSHVNKAAGSPAAYGDGMPAATVYAAARAAGLDFVGMAVDVTAANGGVTRFGDVGTGREGGVTGIPAREIQNNTLTPPGAPRYFREPGADYLHVLTLGGARGISVCVHPRYYELANAQPGGAWRDIKRALLAPLAGGTLDALSVCGLEIYNGFTLNKLTATQDEHRYRDFEEACWDEMLMAGRRCWGFAANDSFVHARDRFDSFAPLGVVYAAVAHGHAAGDIVEALRRGAFYSSTGVELSAIAATVHDDRVRIEVAAARPVNWTARVFENTALGWRLTRRDAPDAPGAVFDVDGQWKYVRVQCERVDDPWARAWLQPIVNEELF